MKVLIIEDDAAIADFLVKGLRQAGHLAEIAGDGSDGLFQASVGEFDVWVIDRMLPRLDGLALLRTLRANGKATPALFLTALGKVEQRVEGLEAGGDDYLVKPFAFSEFLARLVALARRPPLVPVLALLQCGALRLERLQRTVSYQGQLLELQPREFALLEMLMLHKGEVLTRTMLLEKLWDFHFDPRTNIVETHISRLRSKLGEAAELLHTIRGSGYVIRDPA